MLNTSSINILLIFLSNGKFIFILCKYVNISDKYNRFSNSIILFRRKTNKRMPFLPIFKLDTHFGM